MKYNAKELCLIWLDSFIGLEYKHKKAIFDKLGEGDLSLAYFLKESKEDIIAAIGENQYATLLNSARKDYLKFILNSLERGGITAITSESEDYPELLKNTDIPPLVLYAKGRKELLNSQTFAIVGSRRSIPLSLGIAKNFTENLCSAGFTLVTGIAEGVDQTVLETALKCGGNVISVIAGGLFNVYPASNKALADSVAENGLIISEQPPEVKPMPYMFPVRNRIISGISNGVLVVSGRNKSGTVYTAETALAYGRDVFAVPYSVGVESGAYCNKLIKEGAFLADSPEDILSHYGKCVDDVKEEGYTEEEKEILSSLKDGSLHIEKICEITGKTVVEITSVLTVLEIKGKIFKTGTNVYGLVSN